MMGMPLYIREADTYTIDERITTENGITYEVSERISSGGNSVVHRCVNAGNGDEFAIKFNLSFRSNRVQRFLQEVELLKQLNHDQIIKYIDSGSVTGRSNRRGFGNKEILFLIMPLAETNLSEFVKTNRGHIPHASYIGQFRGLCDALAQLHSIAIHRDIKPENILIIGETWFISDLGLCKRVAGDGKGITFHGEPVGPRYWMSPEALNSALGNADIISLKSDVYQLASIFWYVVTGRYPLGVVTKDDWTGPEYLFKPIFMSLHHDPTKRMNNAEGLLAALEVD